MRVAGLAGPQVDGRAGFRLAVLGPRRRAATAAAVVVVVVVDLGPSCVCGDDPCGGPPLLQGVRGLDALLDLLACHALRPVRRAQAQAAP